MRSNGAYRELRTAYGPKPHKSCLTGQIHGGPVATLGPANRARICVRPGEGRTCGRRRRRRRRHRCHRRRRRGRRRGCSSVVVVVSRSRPDRRDRLVHLGDGKW